MYWWMPSGRSRLARSSAYFALSAARSASSMLTAAAKPNLTRRSSPLPPHVSYGEAMAARFTYSRWDGTQRGVDLDADALFGQLTDELLYHGDVNAALRRMLQEGLRTPDGDRVQGLREMLERLRAERQERLSRHDLGGVYDEIARELDDVIDEE